MGQADVSWSLVDAGSRVASLVGTLPLTCTGTLPLIGSVSEAVTLTAHVKHS